MELNSTLRSAATLVALLTAPLSCAQDLIPRAYLVTPSGSNAVTFSYSWNDGRILFDPTVPIDDAKGRFQTSVLSYYHSFSLWGRSSNVVVSLPYATGDFEGSVDGVRAEAYRSGLADIRIRVATNLYGGPAMGLGEFLKWSEKLLVGFSFTAVVPSGQNDPVRLINIGTHRWAFKPEVGVTRRFRRWVFEGYGGVWLYTANPTFYPGNAKRTQRPILATEFHAGYYLKPRLWASLDANFWAFGRSSINGIDKQDRQADSRLGGTISIPFRRRQSFKFSYSRGAYTRVGGNFQTLSAAWQYSGIGIKPR